MKGFDEYNINWGMERKSAKDNVSETIDSKVFRVCVSKCCSRDHTNLAG